MLDKICTNLETSKRLKELGFEAEALFSWYITDKGNALLFRAKNKEEMRERMMNRLVKRIIPAYTLEQILEMLPDNIIVNDMLYFFRCNTKSIFYVGVNPEIWIEGFENKDSESLATTAGKLLIKLKEDKLIC